MKGTGHSSTKGSLSEFTAIGQGQNGWNGGEKLLQWFWQLLGFFLNDGIAIFHESCEESESLVFAVPLETTKNVVDIIVRSFIAEEDELGGEVSHRVSR